VEGTLESTGVGGLTRRMFVRAGVALGALVVAPDAWAKTILGNSRGSLRRQHFKPLVGSKLRMTGGQTDVQVVLAGIHDLLPVLQPHDPNRFSLVFAVPRGHRCAAGIMTFHHRDLGHVDLFVSPVDRGIKARHYEAVINRSRS
jgi:hypothetical protein